MAVIWKDRQQANPPNSWIVRITKFTQRSYANKIYVNRTAILWFDIFLSQTKY
jgi:hypothetical protein